MKSWVWLVLLLGVLLACKKKKEPEASPASTPTVSPNAERGKQLKPKAKERLGQLAALAKKAKSEPAVKSDRPFKTKLEKGQYAVLGDKWLEDVHHEEGADELDLGHTTLSLCEYKSSETTEPTADDLGYLQECIDYKYAAVIRPRRVTLPKIKMATKSFDPGEVDGDLLLFELGTGNLVGRYKMVITNSDKLTWFEGKPEKEWANESKRDLVENVVGVVEERLQLTRDSMYR